jgi:signal transduction histidine kinase/ligand-binding sensor domain-containing protein
VICWSTCTRSILIGIVLAGLVTDALALDPNRLPSQYVSERWVSESRFPGGAVNGIAQTADGYLWIGTDRGLIRFDGFNFKPVSLASITTASYVSILQLLTDARGKLWIRPEGAYLVSQHNDKFESVKRGLYAITAVSKDNHDGVLVSDIEQGTFRFRSDDVQKVAPASPPVISLAETADGKIWMGTLGDGLFLLQGGRATQVNAGLPDRKINCLLAIGSDELWVGTDTGVYRGNSDGFQRVELPPFLGSVQALSILHDRDSNIWVGSARGLLRINAKGVSFSEEHELRGAGGINVLFEDREGNLWMGGARGLGRVRDSAFVTYSSVNDPRFEHGGPIYVDDDGRAWFGPAQGGLYVLENGRVQPVTSIPARDVVYSINGRSDEVWVGRQRGGLTRLRFRNGAIASQSYTETNGLAQNSAYAVYESRDGSVWAGTLNGGVSKFKDGHFTTYTTTNGLAANTISSILETRDGAMWFATPRGVSSFSNGQWRSYSTVEGLPSPEVNCVFEDSSGTLWVGTSVGLAFLAAPHFQALRESPEMLRKQIVGMAEDKSGSLWIATSEHVLSVPRDKILSGVVKAVDVREYGQADGLESTEGVKRNRSVVSDSAGGIWFSLNRGLSVVNPSQITHNSVPALPHIEAVTVDDHTADLSVRVRIPPSPRRISFEYTGLSLAVPERIRFRYFLEGFDRSWSQPVAAREAVYTNLGPGSYRFRLVASNGEGLWNEAGAFVDFSVAPAYYQTTWFLALSTATLIALVWGAHRVRLRIVEKHGQEVTALNERLMKAQEQERIRIAGELHDGIMQNMSAATLMLGTAKRGIPGNSDAKTTIEKAQQILIQAGTEIRQLSHELHPPLLQDAGLPNAVHAYCEQFSTASGIPVACEVDERVGALSRGTALALFRIVQEALGNAAKHAAAKRIVVRLNRSDGVASLTVADDGRGFDRTRLASGGGLGLVMMRERASQLNGTFEFESARERGTTIRVVVPFR